MNKVRVIKYAVFVFEIFIMYIIQNTPNLVPEVFGGKPVILIPVVLTMAIFEKEIPAVVFGVLCGLLIDMGYGGAVGYYGITLAISCFIITNLIGNYIRTNMLTIMIVSSIIIPVIIFVQFLLYYVAMGYTNVWGFFVKHYISRIIYTLILTPVFFKLNSFIVKRTNEK